MGVEADDVADCSLAHSPFITSSDMGERATRGVYGGFGKWVRGLGESRRGSLASLQGQVDAGEGPPGGETRARGIRWLQEPGGEWEISVAWVLAVQGEASPGPLPSKGGRPCKRKRGHPFERKR